MQILTATFPAKVPVVTAAVPVEMRKTNIASGRLYAMEDIGAPPIIPSVTAPNSARIWNYWLGGKDNYTIDRAVGDQVREMFPQIVAIARTQRAFLGRAVRFLAVDRGVRQFLDIGTGLPTADNTHEVAQRAAPGSAVVYADNDPVVITHARALLTAGDGHCAYVEADLRDPGAVLDGAARTLDVGRPIALILLGILGHITDDGEATSIVANLVTALAPGSYLVLADGVNTDPAGNQAQEMYNQRSPLPYHLRSPEQVAGFFAGLDRVEPGVVPCSRWRPAPGEQPEAAVWGGVAHKPTVGEIE
jgi:O-methyltransferase involved in polyketide biosynthesis